MNNGENWTEKTFRTVQNVLGYEFQNRDLLLSCFTHKSYANAFGGEHNERLEFLGDAVLQLAVTETLYGATAEDEGALTELRKQFVSKSALERAEARAGLMQYLRYSGGEHNVGGKTASNLFEAVVAGLYLDGGMAAAKAFLRRYLAVIETENYKSLLQEFVQGRMKEAPHYEVRVAESGFHCTVRALGESAEGAGASKKEAETNAAKTLYCRLTEKER